MKQLLLLLFMIAAFNSYAATITVTSNADTGNNTLRAAITNAADGDVIKFSDAVSTILLETQISLGSISIEIDGLLTNGSRVIINGQKKTRIFDIKTSASKNIVVKNLKIINGFVKQAGGACIQADNTIGTAKLLIQNCHFEGGNIDISPYSYFSEGKGAAIAIKGKSSNNYTYNNQTRIDRCVIQNNKTPGGEGGGISSEYTIISNSLITNNTAYYNDGIASEKSEYINCTIANNTDKGYTNNNSSNANKFKNCIALGNNFNTTSTDIFINSVGNYPQKGTNYRLISTTPFKDMANGDYSLTTNEIGWYCINSGDNAYLPDLGSTTDIANNNRIEHSTVDIGAYEYNYDISTETTAILYVKNQSNDASTVFSLPWAIANHKDGSRIVIDSTAVSEIAITTPLALGDKNVLIDGQGVILNGGNSSSIFKITGVTDKKVQLRNMVFKNGKSTSNGGAINADLTAGALEVTGCLFTNNNATTAGGAIYANGGIYTNNTFAGNTAPMGGGVAISGTASFRNNIFWGNSTDQISGSSATISVDYCAIQNGYTGTGAGANNVNLTATPFVDQANNNLALNGTENGLACLNKGDNSSLPIYHTTDMTGQKTTFYNNTDMGAIESYLIRLTPSKLIVNNSSSSIDEYFSLPWCIYHAVDGDTITFDPTITEIKLARELHIKKAMTIDGTTNNNAKVIINGQAKNRVINIDVSANKIVSLNNLDIYNGNVTGSGGGVLTNGNCQAFISNCIFRNNSCTVEGGGLFLGILSNVSQCTFEKNYANWRGGGMYFAALNNQISNCKFINNEGRVDGGAIYCRSYSTTANSMISNCFIKGNKAHSGGGIFCSGWQGVLVNSTIVENEIKNSWQTETLKGGGLFIYAYTPTISNCIIYNNKIKFNTNGVNTLMDNDYSCATTNATPKFYNCATKNLSTIIWNNTTHTDMVELSDSPFTDYVNGDYSLSTTSANGLKCIGAGLNSAVVGKVPYDYNNSPRIAGDKVDLGYLETKAATDLLTWYVTNESNSATTPQSLPWVIEQIGDMDTIRFIPSVNKITLNKKLLLGSKTVTIDGLKAAKDTVIIDGATATSLFYIEPVSGKTVTMKNMILQNGKTEEFGGAIEGLATNGDIVIESINFKNNTANAGGALYLSDGGKVTNCLFHNNTADGFFGDGGGATAFEKTNFNNCQFINNKAINGGAFYAGNNTIWNQCTVTNNTCSKQGGGIYAYKTSTINNSVITNNTSQAEGGGIYCNASAKVVQCHIANNTALNGGGIYFVFGSYAINCNLINNVATERGGGAYMFSSGNLTNSIVWGNTAESKQQICATATTSLITHCAIQDGYTDYGAGTGNAAPLKLTVSPFLTTTKGDYRLNTKATGGALCLNSGLDEAFPAAITTDLKGNIRKDGVIDLGVYEGGFSNISVTKSGNGEITGNTSQTVKHAEDATELSATAASNNIFQGWYCNNELLSEDITFQLKNVTADMDIVAIFKDPTPVDLELQDEQIKVYPTKFNHTVYVSSASIINSIEVYNIAGSLIYKEKPATNAKGIDLSALPQGTYVIDVKTTNGNKKVKAIKE